MKFWVGLKENIEMEEGEHSRFDDMQAKGVIVSEQCRNNRGQIRDRWDDKYNCAGAIWNIGSTTLAKKIGMQSIHIWYMLADKGNLCPPRPAMFAC